jgi:hypothetical protein
VSSAGALIAELTSPTSGAEKVLRERWRVTDGDLEAANEAGGKRYPW